jgi:hypothetical protein
MMFNLLLASDNCILVGNAGRKTVAKSIVLLLYLLYEEEGNLCLERTGI